MNGWETGTGRWRKYRSSAAVPAWKMTAFLKLIEKKRIETGDVFVFHYAGAYTMAFNSEFILQPPRVYVVNEDR